MALARVYVVPTVKGRVSLMEQHPDHPGGEVRVYWPDGVDDQPEPVLVALTPSVRAALGKTMEQVVGMTEQPKTPDEIKLEKAINDLSKIKGIGQSLASGMIELGIYGLSDLAMLEDVEGLADHLNRGVSQVEEWRDIAHAKITGG